MDKLTAIKIKYDDGTYSDEIPISALSENVEWDSTHTLVDILGNIDVDVTGTIQDQISQLSNSKVSGTELNNYIASQLNEDVSSWLNTNVNPVGSAVIVDKTLTIDGAAADAKMTGNKIFDLKENINEMMQEDLYEQTYESISGLYIGPNVFSTASQTTFFIKYIEVEAGKTYKITASPIKTLDANYGIVAFSENLPAEQVSLTQLVHGSTTAINVNYNYTPSKNGYLSVAIATFLTTDLHFYTVKRKIKINTDDTLKIIGAPADAKTTGDAINNLNGQIENTNNRFNDIAKSYDIQTEIASERVDRFYINTNFARFGIADVKYFWVKTIPVEAGKTYRIVADQIKTLFDQYGLVAFSEQYPAAYVSLTVLVNGSTTVIPIDYTYTPEENGYISVALHSSVNTDLHFYEINDVYHVITDKTLAEINMPADAKETGDRFSLLGYTTESEKEDVVSAEHIITDRYISANGTIRSAGSTAFAVAWYPVKIGSAYTITGTASVGGEGQALVCFDNVYDSATNHICKTVIQTATTTDTEYDINYTPTENGYIVIPYISRVKLVVTLVSDTDFQRIYDLEKTVDEIEAEIGKTKMPVKIQLFGDSITDNQWGDKLTWANYIQDNLSDYNVTVINDAVGGSGIGHGASKGTTESHQTEEYNYVYDLVTDGTTLQTDANYIVILVGTNNWASGTDLGDMSSTGTATIYGALKGILEYIAQHTKATVFVCTIPQRYNSVDQSRTTNAYGEPLNSDNVSLADYCEPFRKVSAFYGMPCVHLNEALGWNRLNMSNFSGDGLHPNSIGDKMLSAFICSEIQKHIGKVSYT